MSQMLFRATLLICPATDVDLVIKKLQEHCRGMNVFKYESGVSKLPFPTKPM